MNLLDMPIIQVALAIVISWALFAIFMSLIQEGVAKVMAQRGRFMKKYMLRQLWDESNNINWGQLIYLNGSIDLLTREPNKPTNDIDPALFAQALIETIGQSQAARMNATVQENVYENRTLNNFRIAVTTLVESDVISFLRSALNNAEIVGRQEQDKANEAIIYRELNKSISTWYTEFLQRLSLWYQKKVRQRLFIFGFIVAVLLNVDSIQLFNYYKQNPQSREAVQHYYTNYMANLDSTGENRGATTTRDIASIDSLVKNAGLPVGFDYSILCQHKAKANWWIWKVIGLLVTGFAASAGAPFWFDILRKAYSANKVNV